MSLESVWNAPSAWLSKTIADQGVEGLESLGTNLAIGGTALQMWSNFQAGQDKLEAQKDSYKNALNDRKRALAHNLSMYKENARFSNENVIFQYKQVMGSIRQHQIAAENEVANITREARQNRATLISGQADRGVTGPTENFLIDQFERLELEDAANIRLQQEWAETAKKNQLEEIYARGQSRQMSRIPSPAPALKVPALASSPNLLTQAMAGVGQTLKTKARFGDISRKANS
tara:strand:- start:23 stop:721 length:699 start_codon:yes stop_codon:yes gene_type:complete